MLVQDFRTLEVRRPFSNHKNSLESRQSTIMLLILPEVIGTLMFHTHNEYIPTIREAI